MTKSQNKPSKASPEKDLLKMSHKDFSKLLAQSLVDNLNKKVMEQDAKDKAKSSVEQQDSSPRARLRQALGDLSTLPLPLSPEEEVSDELPAESQKQPTEGSPKKDRAALDKLHKEIGQALVDNLNRNALEQDAKDKAKKRR